MALSAAATESGKIPAKEKMSEVERSVGILVMPDKKNLENFGNLLARSALSLAISTS
jgi:hypothetical protein